MKGTQLVNAQLLL